MGQRANGYKSFKDIKHWIRKKLYMFVTFTFMKVIYDSAQSGNASVQKKMRYLCLGKSYMSDFLDSLFPISFLFCRNFNRLFQNNDISSDRDISCSIDSESSFESSSIVIDTSTVTISNEVYQRLLKASTDVYKANDTIEKLKDTIRKKDAKIEEIQKECSVLKRNAINWNQLSIVSFQ